MKYEHVFSICAYKDSPYLERCIRSLKGQTWSSHIIICTSTPSRYIDELAWRYGIKVFVRHGESSIKDDWNFAYAAADGELVTIAHQDDMYHKDYVKELMAAYRRYPDMTVFTTDYGIVKNGRLLIGNKRLWVKRLLRMPLRIPALNNRTWVKKSVFMLGNPICCPATSYQKLKLGEPLIQCDYSFALDWDNMLRLAGEPGRFICVERPLLFYRVHDEATTKACIRDNRRALEEEAMFRRLWPAFMARWLMRFYRAAYHAYD